MRLRGRFMPNLALKPAAPFANYPAGDFSVFMDLEL